MQAVKLKVNITSDHRLICVVPDDVPPGEMEAIVLYKAPQFGADDQMTQILLYPANLQEKEGVLPLEAPESLLKAQDGSLS